MQSKPHSLITADISLSAIHFFSDKEIGLLSGYGIETLGDLLGKYAYCSQFILPEHSWQDVIRAIEKSGIAIDIEKYTTQPLLPKLGCLFEEDN